MMQALLKAEYPENAAADDAANNDDGNDAKPQGDPAAKATAASATAGVATVAAHPNLLKRIHLWVDERFETLRDEHGRLLNWALGHRKIVLAIFIVYVIATGIALPFVGEDFFPQVDSGQMRLHLRTPPGTRIEEAGRDFASVETTVRQLIPNNQVSLMVDNIGQAGSLNAVYSTSGTIGSEDGEIDISLTPKHTSVWDIEQTLRKGLHDAYPSYTFYFQPADITSQILDFGISAPIDIQVGGPIRNDAQDIALATQIQKQVAGVPGVVDCYVYQVTNEPSLNINVDRSEAMQVGLTQSNVASSLLDSLSSSFQTSPSYFLDPTTGVQYSVSAETPLYKVNSISSILNVPITATSTGTSSGTAPPPQLLRNLAHISHFTSDEVISHYNINPVYDVYASVQNRDLGSVSRDINRVLDTFSKKTPKGSSITMQGQVATMNSSFTGLGYGLIFAIVLIYILLVVNFESWVEPFIIMVGAPCALCGVVWMLFITQTTFSVPALMGTIMCIGVATSNSILLITYANDARKEGKNAIEAALAAGHTRLRPVIMTASAMIIGVLPMALGWAEGGEQNAPLGRAVIGGLLVATVSTLTFVPVVYSVVQKKQPEPEIQLPGDDEINGK
jgi:multidrug efflux pump subunit AcrB